jgi:hypothetical protein
MPIRARRRLHLCWPHHYGPWHHPLAPYGPPPAWGPPWWGTRPGPEEEKQALADYIAALKEELEDAEAHLKELEGSE